MPAWARRAAAGGILGESAPPGMGAWHGFWAFHGGGGEPTFGPQPMGQQYNKVIKRRRRRAYLERVKARIKSARTSKKKAGKK